MNEARFEKGKGQNYLNPQRHIKGTAKKKRRKRI